MSTVLEPPQASNAQRLTAAQRLRGTMAAVRVSISWLGVRKSLTPDQKAQAAETFGAAGNYLSAGKKLLDTRHPAFLAVTNVRHRLTAYWKGLTLPYPEPGIRLIRQADVAPFAAQMERFQGELATAVAELNRQYNHLQSAARVRLGQLFAADDYPHSLDNLFIVEWDFPSVEPPDYLRELNPELYAQEQSRVAERFDEAVRLAEEAFTSELAGLVSHLAERLSGSDDGRPKIFRDSAITRLTEFFERFRTLSIRSQAELEQLVDRVQGLVRGIEPQQLRNEASLRQHVARELAQVQTSLDEMLIERPRRQILRRAK